MKLGVRTICLLALLAALSAVGQAYADSSSYSSYVEVKYAGPGATQAAMIWRDGVYEGNVWTGVYQLAVNSTAGTYSGSEARSLVASASTTGSVVQAFCMDLRQDVPGRYSTYGIVDLTKAPIGDGNTPMSAKAAMDLQLLFGKYYVPNLTASQAAAFEACVWEIVYEHSGTYNVFSGDMHLRTTMGSGWGSLANQWLSDLGNTPNASVKALVNEQYQDFAITIAGSGTRASAPVPEPLTLVTCLLSVGGLGVYLKRTKARLVRNFRSHGRTDKLA